MDENLKDRYVLLVNENESGELKAVSGIDRNGNLKTVEAEAENVEQFLKIDRNGNALENFMSDVIQRVKNPEDFQFFQVKYGKFEKLKEGLEELLMLPHIPQNKEMLKRYEVNPNDFSVKQPAHAIDENRVDWSQFERIGISRDTLEKTGNLEKLLNWQKTDLLIITPKFDDVTLRTDARLGLREMPDGKLSLSIHAMRREPELHRPYFGVRFSQEDKQNILETGNLGRIVEAEYKPGEKTPVYLSVDKQTNELVAVRADNVKIPENIKGVELNDQQRMDLANGKAAWVEGMTSKNGKEFSAYLQFNADKKGFEFLFDTNRKQGQRQNQGNEQIHVPKTFRKKELTDDQCSSLKEGKTVYVDGLVDKKGKGYSGYVSLNMETGKTNFMFPKDYKDALAAGTVVPDDRHKTQVAGNSEGKSHEALQKVDKPLKTGQSEPTEKQAAKQEEEKQKQSRRQKM
jgi:hypothetical protein